MIFPDRASLDKIRNHCLDKFGFEDAFSQATLFFVSDLVNCIDNNKIMKRIIYSEPIDFIDGNGFKVEGNETNGYKISLA